MRFIWLWKGKDVRSDKEAAYDALDVSRQQRAEQAEKREAAEKQAERFIWIRERNHFAEALDRALREQR